MPVPPFFRHLTRTTVARRLAIILSLVFVAAVAVPFATEGARNGGDGSEPSPFRLRRAGSKPGASGAAAEFVPGSLLVRFRTETAARRAEGSPAAGRGVILDGAEGQIGATVTRFEGSDLVRGLRLVQVEPDQTLAAVEAFKSRADVLYAEPDYVRRATNTPNDPLFNQMYGLLKISAPGAWDTTQGGGSSVVVGVVDEGVDINHPDLQANIWTNPGEIPGNGVDDDGDGKIDDVHGWDFSTCTGSTFTITTPPDNCGNNTVYDGPGIEDQATKFPTDGHGTHVAGTIGAAGNNSTGVVGVNWNVKILPLKFLGTSGGSASNAIRAEAYAKALRDKYVATGGAQGANVRVLNNSYGGGGSSQAELDSIKAVGDSGILFVVAAGNETSNNDLVPAFPANYDAPNLIAVAATDSNDQISSFSNFGAHLVSVAAPGSSILSTFARTSASQPYGYAFLSGTSMATPHVAGLAALICALNPQLDVLKLRNIVAFNGDPISAAAGKVYTQRRINAAGSVQAALENDTTPPGALGNLQVAQSGRSVTLSFTAPGDDGNSGTASLYEVSFVSASTGTTYFIKTQLPKAGGLADSITVNVPLRQTSGTLRVKTFDNVGNVSVSDANVTVNPSLADPYMTSEAANTGLAPLGSALNFHQDDGYKDVPLPSGFSFPFFGQQNTSVVISSNGTLYLQPLNTLPTADPNNDLFGDSVSSTQGLEGFRMVAGLWDDLRTDCATPLSSGVACDVYENASDPNKVIFRWEGIPCNFNGTQCTGTTNTPVEFEIELDRDGTILTRYGAGNTNVQPVVGIGAGEPGGSYVISSHSYPNVTSLTNAATVTFTPRPTVVPPTLQFSAASYTFSEGNITPQGTNAAQVVVTRAGDTSSSASVEVRTVDNVAPVPCGDTTTLPGVAFARCDYETVVTTVSWAAGDTQPKTITIPLVNDSFVEPNESFNVVLVNPQGATLGTPATTAVTITDNDVAGEQNPIFGADFFIRQQYLDFLAREPDAAGMTDWRTLLNGCPNPFNIAPNNSSSNCDRVTVSANFFLSAEFQLKGAYVFRFYKLSFGRLPLYTEFTPDTASVTGATAQEVFANKAAFANAWVQRSGFVSQYGGLDNTQFVNALMDRYSLASVTTPDPLNPDGSTKITMTRADMINRLSGFGSALRRAQVVRAIADSDEVSAREQNAAFVAMQYFGYLRRDPDAQGFNDWNTYLAAHPGDVRTMVVGFVTSGEYFQRFGQP